MLLAFQDPGAAPPHAEDETLVERIRLFDESVDPVNRLSGVLLIARGPDVLVHLAFGMADQEFGVRNALETRFCIASITKIMTSLVTWQLQCEGRLQPSDRLAKFVPDFPRGDEITVGHLLNHRAGLPARVTKPSETWRSLNAEQVTERAKTAELLFAPGTQSVYSSASYTVLARVIEIVEERPFGEVLRQRIFEPAGMLDTCDPGGRELVARRARPYVPGRDALLNAPLQDLSFLAGAGSVVSTASDLRRFLEAYRGEAFGANAWTSTQGSAAHWTGASNGFHSFVDYDPATGLTVIFTGNSYGRAAGELRTALPRILAGEDVLAAPRPATIVVEPSILRRYSGLYQSRPGSFWPVEVLDGELMISDVVALPISATEFWYQPWNARMHFERESDESPWTLRPEGQAAWRRVGELE
jgi:CubicO group peptidase (beta-lactamase class C family)